MLSFVICISLFPLSSLLTPFPLSPSPPSPLPPLEVNEIVDVDLHCCYLVATQGDKAPVGPT